ncbi:MAG: oligosaccharide flippase family protein [Candidatus Aegiribacteria sp.]|nr:oligosaccharide flippase family protein [Candidatus Aegiribacteria sp.]
MKDLTKHATIFGMSNMLRQGIGLILLPVYLSLIPPAQYGILSMLMISSNLISLLTSSTLAPALFRSYYDYDDHKGHSTVITTALVFTTGLAFFFIVVCSFFSEHLSLLLTGDKAYSTLAVIVLISAGARAVNTICLTVFRVKKWSKQYAILSFITMLTSLLTIIYLVVIRNMGIKGIVLGNLTGAVIGTCLSLFYIRRELAFRISFMEIKKMYAFGYPHIPENFTAFAVTASTRMILRIFTGSAGVGIFALGYRIASLLEKLIITPLNMIAPASIMSVEKETNPGRHYSALARYYFCITGFMAMILSVMAKPLLLIFSKQGYFDAWKVVPFIALSIIAYGGRGLISVGLMLKRKTIWYPIAYALGSMISLGLMVILVDKFGPPGAALALLIGNLTTSYIRNRASKKYLYVKIDFGKILKAFSIYAFFGTMGCFLSTGNPFVDSAIFLLLAFTFVPFLLVRLGVFEIAEFKSFQRSIIRRLRSFITLISELFSKSTKIKE